MLNRINIINNEIILNVISHSINNIKAILIHLHGLGNNFQPIPDFNTCNNISSIENKIKYFSSLNILSFALELRGHGLSGGKRFTINSIDEYISDINCLVEYIKKNHQDIPIYIIGESLGGALAIKYSILNKDIISGIILLAPMCGVHIETYSKQLLYYLLIGFSYIYPSYELNIKGKDLSSNNIKYLEAKKKCIYTNNGNIRADTARECYYTTLWINKNIHLLTTPIIAFHSNKDVITNSRATEDIINRCSSTNKQLVLMEEGDHLLLIHMNDEDVLPDKIMTTIYNWLNELINYI